MGQVVTEKISQAGVYDIPREQYHGDSAIGPSLSASGAKTLVDSCPAVFWHESYLNPDYAAEQKTDFDIGNASHLIMLEPEQWGARVVEVEANDYRTKAAQEARDAAYAAGKTPLLPKHRDKIIAMHKALMRHPIARTAFTQGLPEQSYFCRDEKNGVWLKARPDFMPSHGKWIVDYKSTGSANPREFKKRAWDNGYAQQAAWYLDVVEAVTGSRPDEFWFVAQETDAPHLVSVCKLDERALSWGAILNRRAIDVFAKCCAANSWPGYRDPQKPDRDAAFVISLPTYAEFQLEERREAGEFAGIDFAHPKHQRAADMQRP